MARQWYPHVQLNFPDLTSDAAASEAAAVFDDEAAAALRMDEGYLRRMASVNDYFDMSSFFNILMRKLV